MPDTNLEYTKSWLSEEDFPHLGFTRNWESPTDYPTYEPDEAVVRKDMQSLHDETKDYINNELIPAVVESNSTEAFRKAQEDARQEAEIGRTENELERIAAEELREQAEQVRVDETEGVVARAGKASESWAVGGTGTREGEDTNNAKYWSEQARSAAGGGVTSFNGRTGAVTPQKGDYTHEQVGAAPVIHASQHASDGKDPIMPEMIGAAPLESPAFTGTPTLNGAPFGTGGGGIGRNLLINSYFPAANVVDQRGGYVVPPGTTYFYGVNGSQTGVTAGYVKVDRMDYTSSVAWITVDGEAKYTAIADAVRGYTGAGYGIDMWRSWEADNTTTIHDGHITVTRQHAQVIDPAVVKAIRGRTVTMSLLLADGTLHTATGVFSYTDGVSAEVGPKIYINGGFKEGGVSIFNWYSSEGQISFQINTAVPCSPVAAGLDLGTTQTLAHQENGKWVLNEIPDYGEELAKCQWYYEKSVWSVFTVPANNTNELEFTGTYFFAQPKYMGVNDSALRVTVGTPKQGQSLNVLDASNNMNRVSNAALAAPIAYNARMFSPRITGTFVVGHVYRVEVPDYAYEISSSL